MSPTELVVKEAFSPPCQTLPVCVPMKLPSELVVKEALPILGNRSAPCQTLLVTVEAVEAFEVIFALSYKTKIITSKTTI